MSASLPDSERVRRLVLAELEDNAELIDRLRNGYRLAVEVRYDRLHKPAKAYLTLETRRD